MSAHPYIESTVAAALASLDRAMDDAGDMDRDVLRNLLLCYEQLRATQELIEVERRIRETSERATRFVTAPTPLRVVT